MINSSLLETVLDNSPDGIYVLDSKGSYIYANSIYIQMVNMTKSQLLDYNVYEFLNSKQIDVCISDIVYREKRRVCMFQDLYDKENKTHRKHRQLVISNPIFDSNGDVCNIIAYVRPINTMNKDYHQASMSKSITVISSEEESHGDIIAESSSMRGILDTAKSMANIDSTILISGESGTGKEVIAQFIHSNGVRKNNPLVVINCASLPATLLEAELFGYEKGAFTGAINSKAGLFEKAHEGTLFLDEINSLPFELQGKLLRAIETKSIQRIGSTKLQNVDFRLIAATNEDLSVLVAEKKFRSDLYYRLNVIPIKIPPLRNRREDILPLTMQFLCNYCDKYNKSKLFTEQTLALIHNYDWPGNVRELKNFVERSVVMSNADFIEIPNIEGIAQGIPIENITQTINSHVYNGYDYGKMIENGISLDDHVSSCESAYVQYALETYSSTYLVAKALSTSQASIMRKKKKYNI